MHASIHSVPLDVWSPMQMEHQSYKLLSYNRNLFLQHHESKYCCKLSCQFLTNHTLQIPLQAVPLQNSTCQLYRHGSINIAGLVLQLIKKQPRDLQKLPNLCMGAAMTI